MAEHPIENIMKTTMENIKDMIDVSTIVGDAVETGDGTVIIPISKVSLGFVAGGGEYNDNDKNESESKRFQSELSQDSAKDIPFVGGTGAGVSVNPIAFLVVGEGKIKLLPVHFASPVDRIIELVPQVVEEMQGLLGGKKEKKGTEVKKEEIAQ